MTISVASFGEFEGKRVDQAKLKGADGVEVSILNWGVAVQDWLVPAPEGQRRAVLGFDNFAAYPASGGHFGAIAGRIANRVKGARFTLDGKTYTLDANSGNNAAHGGSVGLGRRLWDLETDESANAVRFTTHSPDGDMGFPGNVDFTAIYRLDGHKLSLELSGVPDRPTPISLVQHIYFNLGLQDTVLDHQLQFPHGVARTELDEEHVPNGIILPTAGTEYDFMEPHNMRDKSGQGIDYNLNYVLATRRNPVDPIAIVTGEDDALTLRLWTDRPGVQFYNAIATNVAAPGHDGKHYGKYAGLCLEDQMFPDSVHHGHFPNTICTPDNPYHHTCSIDISESA